MRALLVSLALGIAACVHFAAKPSDPVGFYGERCAPCHGALRYGGYAPPLIPLTLERKSDDVLARTILEGLPNTQMEGFQQWLTPEDATRLVALLREPVGPITWGMDQIAASRLEPEIEADRIAPEVRRENLILVVERGTGSIVVLDGDSMRELDRFWVGSIHGGPKFDAELRKVVAATRDGTLVDYDLARGGLRTKVKVGVNTRNVALSPDGAFVAVANLLPATLVILDGRLHPLATFPLPGQPSAVYQVPDENRFVLTLRDVPRLLSVSYPELALREVEIPEPFEDFTPVPGGRRVVASARDGRQLLLYDLAREAVIGRIETEGLPHLFSACFFERDEKLYAAFNHIGVARLSVIDMERFRVEKEIPLRGSGFFVRTHRGTPFLWVDTNTEAIQLVDKQSLTLHSESIKPEAGKLAMHVEFTAEGDRALVSVWHPEGAVVIYDAVGLEEVMRLPYALPVGKYNARNKTRLLD